MTDHFYHGMVKDPPRKIPQGNVIVAPADGTILYIRHIRNGIIPQVVKKGVPVPVTEHIKGTLLREFKDGYLMSIYMNTQGVHINRIPNKGQLKKQIIFNGPHMDMTSAETHIVLSQLIPGLITIKKMFGMEPFNIEKQADYILKSARETLIIEDERKTLIYIIRIADYYVGKILTWIKEGDSLERGQKLGMITWGSQTDILFESTAGLTLMVESGDYVYAGETIIAQY